VKEKEKNQEVEKHESRGRRKNNSPRANKILNRKKKSRNIYQKQKREGEEKGKEGGRGGGGGGRGGEYVETSAAARHRRRAHHRSPQRAVTLHPLTLPLRASSLLELLSKTKESKSEGRRLTTEWRIRNAGCTGKCLGAKKYRKGAAGSLGNESVKYYINNININQ